MAIKIGDIPPEGLTVELADKLDLFDEGPAPSPFTASLTFSPLGAGRFRVTGTVSTAVELECSRCLKRYTLAVRGADVDVSLAPELSGSVPGEHELGSDELDTEFYEGDAIEPADIIREQVLLALPMVPVHSEDCRGLCPICGTDLNERTCSCDRTVPAERESPFAVLKKIINPEKE